MSAPPYCRPWTAWTQHDYLADTFAMRARMKLRVAAPAVAVLLSSTAQHSASCCLGGWSWRGLWLALSHWRGDRDDTHSLALTLPNTLSSLLDYVKPRPCQRQSLSPRAALHEKKNFISDTHRNLAFAICQGRTAMATRSRMTGLNNGDVRWARCSPSGLFRRGNPAPALSHLLARSLARSLVSSQAVRTK